MLIGPLSYKVDTKKYWVLGISCFWPFVSEFFLLITFNHVFNVKCNISKFIVKVSVFFPSRRKQVNGILLLKLENIIFTLQSELVVFHLKLYRGVLHYNKI